MIMLDTHIAVTLYAGRLAGLGNKARQAIDREAAVVSPAVVLELELLHEIGRLRVGAKTILRFLDEHLSIRVAQDGFAEVAGEALNWVFTRDPFDRLIVAHAALRDAPLVTLDETIRRHYGKVLH